MPYFLTIMAEGYLHLDQVDKSLDALNEGLNVMEHTVEHWWKAEVHRLQGELLLHRVSLDIGQAEHCFQQALDVSRHQQAKSLELRAAMSMARLWRAQGNGQGAYDLLSSVYDWFSEGFDTADLIDAKALLVELS